MYEPHAASDFAQRGLPRDSAAGGRPRELTYCAPLR